MNDTLSALVHAQCIMAALFAQVQASTVVGYGPGTPPLEVSTLQETPVPLLLIFTSNSLWLADVDLQETLNHSQG